MLVVVDLRGGAARVVEAAVALARGADGFDIACATPWPPPWLLSASSAFATAVQAAASQLLSSLIEDLPGQASNIGFVVDNRSERSLLDVAATRRYELIVLGLHGRTRRQPGLGGRRLAGRLAALGDCKVVDV